MVDAAAPGLSLDDAPRLLQGGRHIAVRTERELRAERPLDLARCGRPFTLFATTLVIGAGSGLVTRSGMFQQPAVLTCTSGCGIVAARSRLLIDGEAPMLALRPG